MTPTTNEVETTYDNAPDDFSEIMELTAHDALLIKALHDLNYREKILALLYSLK